MAQEAQALYPDMGSIACRSGGGAILGDKTRITELGAPTAFIRPSSAGDRRGGVARRACSADGIGSR